MDIHSSLTMIDYTVILIYIIILLALGFWVSFRKKHTKDIFLAGNTLGWPNVGLSIFGTNVSPTMMIASCGIAYTSGMVAANFEWLAWIFLMLLGMVYFPRYMNMKISTMPEFLEKRFGKPCRHFLTWYTMLGIIITWLGGSLYAGGILLVQIFDWPLWVCLAFLILISTSFTVTGGLAAVVITDSFQSILIIVTSAALTVIGLVKVGGVSGLIEAAPEGYWTLFRPSDAPIYPWYVIVLGYPVMSIWFWCADQTIVQRVLGAKDLRNGQLGTVFAGFIKIITPLIFLVPGILCFVLHPGLDNSDKAYMTMVTSYFPTGLIGLIIAVLIAALVSTVDSGLNSMSTVFTLDFYCKKLRPEAQRKETILVGRIVTILTAFIAFFVSWSMSFAGKNLFDLFQCLISFLAPPISAVFLLGILWKRATPKAAFTTLIVGGILSALAGICHFGGWPTDTFWPHPLVLSFLLFVGLVILMSVLSLRDQQPADKFAIATLKEIYTAKNYNPKKMWNLWILLAVIMVFLYLLFQFGI